MNFELIFASASTLGTIITYLVFVHRHVNKDWWAWLCASGLFGLAAAISWISVIVKW